MGNFLTIGGGVFTIGQIVFNIILTFGLSLLITWVYRKTHKGLSYSQSFVFTLVLMSIIVAIVMMVIGNSLARAFGLLGAFSIIRFRTVVKETKDTGYIFFALSIGMAVGTGNYLIAVAGTILVLLIIWILDKVNFGSMHSHEFLLTFAVNHEERDQTPFEDIFKKYFKGSLLLNINSKQDGKMSEMTYNITFKDTNQVHDLIRDLSAMAGVGNVDVVSSKSDIEY